MLFDRIIPIIESVEQRKLVAFKLAKIAEPALVDPEHRDPARSAPPRRFEHRTVSADHRDQIGAFVKRMCGHVFRNDADGLETASSAHRKIEHERCSVLGKRACDRTRRIRFFAYIEIGYKRDL